MLALTSGIFFGGDWGPLVRLKQSLIFTIDDKQSGEVIPWSITAPINFQKRFDFASTSYEASTNSGDMQIGWGLNPAACNYPCPHLNSAN